jgi:hypothetical protein
VVVLSSIIKFRTGIKVGLAISGGFSNGGVALRHKPGATAPDSGDFGAMLREKVSDGWKEGGCLAPDICLGSQLGFT